MKRLAASLPALIGAGLALGLAAAPVRAAAPTLSAEVVSQAYTIDGTFRSMAGPGSTQSVRLSNAEVPELLWITGYGATVVGPDGREPRSQEFLCHSNLDLDMKTHESLFGWKKTAADRLFTLSQGQQEIAFPAGFGIPVMSTETFSLGTQVLNFDASGPAFDVRHKVRIDYVRDRDLDAPMKPLFMKAVAGLKLLEGPDGHFGAPHGTGHGEGCAEGEKASSEEVADPQGRRFTGHWKVKPGREENRTPVTAYLSLPYDTTVHYVAVHLHPFAESLELRDVTAGKSLFKSRAYPREDGKVGISRVEHFASAEGIPLSASHEYELVSVYDNTSDVEQDSMAVMFLYLLEKDFVKPTAVVGP